jgi:prevent-host-death family protein
MKQFSIVQTRDSLTSIIRDVESGSSVELTRRGKPVAVLMSLEEYQAVTSKKVSFTEAYKRFREEDDLNELGFTKEFFDDLRDRSEGREVNL